MKNDKILEILINLFGKYEKVYGNNYMFHCPLCGFSKNKRPHMGINIERGIYGCFRCGASGKVGDLIRSFIPSFNINISTDRFTTPKTDEIKLVDIKIIDNVNNIHYKCKKYIESRLGSFERFVKSINFHSLPFYITDDDWLITPSIFGSYISFRLLKDDRNINKKLLKIKDVGRIDPFIYKIYPSSEDIANVFIFEGMFDMLTHVIHMNKNLCNSYYIICNGKITGKILNIIKTFIVEENRMIYLFKDSDVMMSSLYQLKNRYFNDSSNFYIYYFDKSKDLNASYINYKFSDLNLVRSK